MGIPLFGEDDVRLLSYYSECWVPYHPKCSRILYVTDHHTWHGFLAGFSMALRLGDKSTGVAAESSKVVERRIVRDFIAMIVVRGLAKCLQHLVWSWI